MGGPCTFTHFPHTQVIEFLGGRAAGQGCLPDASGRRHPGHRLHAGRHQRLSRGAQGHQGLGAVLGGAVHPRSGSQRKVRPTSTRTFVERVYAAPMDARCVFVVFLLFGRLSAGWRLSVLYGGLQIVVQRSCSRMATCTSRVTYRRFPGAAPRVAGWLWWMSDVTASAATHHWAM